MSRSSSSPWTAWPACYDPARIFRAGSCRAGAHLIYSKTSSRSESCVRRDGKAGLACRARTLLETLYLFIYARRLCFVSFSFLLACPRAYSNTKRQTDVRCDDKRSNCLWDMVPFYDTFNCRGWQEQHSTAAHIFSLMAEDIINYVHTRTHADWYETSSLASAIHIPRL